MSCASSSKGSSRRPVGSWRGILKIAIIKAMEALQVKEAERVAEQGEEITCDPSRNDTETPR
jgi:hypothetical protein